MIHLADTNDKLQVVTSAAVTVDVVASWSDLATTTVTTGKQLTAITTATTTDIVAAPGASTTRRIHSIFIRNKHASTPVDVTVIYLDNATGYEIHKATLLAGEMLEYMETLGWFTVQTTRKEFYLRRVTADSVHATAATFADVTGLTCPVTSGKQYNFEAHLYHLANATTTGAQFAIGGVAMTAMRIQALDVIAGSVTAATMGSNVGDVTAINTAAMVETTGATATVLAIFSGWFNPSASGTFAIRATSEVSVAAGLTIKQGSWAQIWESDN